MLVRVPRACLVPAEARRGDIGSGPRATDGCELIFGTQYSILCTHLTWTCGGQRTPWGIIHLLYTRWILSSNSGCQACQWAPLSAEPSQCQGHGFLHHTDSIPFGYIVRRGTTELHGVLPCHFGGCYCFPSCLCWFASPLTAYLWSHVTTSTRDILPLQLLQDH